MKTVNRRFVLTASAVAILIGCVAFLVHFFQVRRFSTFYRDRAVAAEKDGRLGEAVRELSFYTTLVDDDVEAELTIGKLLSELGQDNAAYRTLEKALRTADDEEARRELVDVLLRLRRHRDARVHLESQLLKAHPDDPVLLDRLAQCEWATNQFEQAAHHFRMAIAGNPGQTESYVRLIAILDAHPEVGDEEAGQRRDAAYWSDALIQKNGESGLAFLSRARRQYLSVASNKEDLQADSHVTGLKTAMEDAARAVELFESAEQGLGCIKKALEDHDTSLPVNETLGSIGAHLAGIPLVQRKLEKVLHHVEGDNIPRATSGLDGLTSMCWALEADALWIQGQCELSLSRMSSEPTADRLEQARTTSRRIIQVSPKDPRGYESLAEVELAAGSRPEAIKCLEQGYRAVGERNSLLPNLIRMQLDDGQTDAAKANVTSELGKWAYPPPLVKYFQARISFADGQWDTALSLFKQARDASAGSPDLSKEICFWIGQTYEKQPYRDVEVRRTNVSESLHAYRMALSLAPDFHPAREALARLLLQNGQIDEALQNYLAMSGGAIDAQKQAVQLSVYRNLGLPTAQQDWRGVDAMLDEIDKVALNDVQARLLRADVLLVRGQVDDAAGLYDKWRQEFPQEPAYWAAAARLAIMRGDMQRGEQLLEEGMAQVGDSAILRLARAEQLTFREKSGEDTPLETLLDNDERFSGDERIRLWRGLAPLFMEVKNYEGAERCVRNLCKQTPDDIAAWELQMDLAMARADDRLTEQALSNIERIERGKGENWNYARAILLAAQADAAGTTAEAKNDLRGQALSHLETALRLKPRWPEALLLQAQLTEITAKTQQDRDVALRLYLTAVETRGNFAEAILAAARLLYQKGDLPQASQLIARLGAGNGRLSLEAQRMRSRMAVGTEDLDTALELARSAAANSKQAIDHIWQAQLCAALAAQSRKAGRTSEADNLVKETREALQLARTLEPTSPAPWMAGVGYLMSEGLIGEAKELANAGCRAIDRQKYPTAVADLCWTVKDQAGALAAIDMAAREHKDDGTVIRRVAEYYLQAGRLPENLDQIQGVVKGDIPATQEVVMACRRLWGISLSGKGGTANVDTALALIQENLKQDPASVLDIRAKAILLARHPARERRREAVSLLEDLLKRDQRDADTVRQILGDLYLAEGNWDAAAPYLRDATDLESIVTYSQQLIARRDFSAAEGSVTKLEQLFPAEIMTPIVRAELQFRRQEYDKAMDTLGTAVRDVPAATKSQLLLIAATALGRWGDELRRTQPGAVADRYLSTAETYFREKAELGADERLDLAVFLAFHEKFDEASDLLASASERASTSAIARASAVLTTVATSKDLGKIEQALNLALTRQGRPPELLDASAALLTKMERWDEAIAIYSELIRLRPENFAAKNNLAEILALSGERLDEAKGLIDEAIQFAGPMPALRDTRATVLLAMKELEQALAEMQTVVQEAPSASRYFHLARIHDAMGQKDKARIAMQEAITRGVDESKLHPLEKTACQRLRSALN